MIEPIDTPIDDSDIPLDFADEVEAEEPTGFGIEGDAEEPEKPRKSRRIVLFGSAFLVGLFLGWLLIGWWLWPVKWTNSNPWDLRSDHQRTFVRLIAEDYWRTGDIQQARAAVDGWDQETLTQLIATLANEAPSLEEREHLAALAEALQMPKPPVVVFTSLLGQEVLLFSALLVAAPLLGAIVYVMYPSVGSRRVRRGGPLKRRPGGAREELGDELEYEYEGEDEGEGEDEDEYDEYGEDEEYDDDLVIGAGEAEEEEFEEEEEIIIGGEEREEVISTQDVFMSMFEDEDEELGRLEELAKSMADIDIDDLLEQGKDMASELTRGNLNRSRDREDSIAS